MLHQSAKVQQEIDFDPQHTHMPRDIKVDGYGKLMASSSVEGRINVFELEEKGQPRLVTTAAHYVAPVNCIEWGPKDQACRLASCGEEGKVVIYRYENSQLTVELEKATEQTITSVAWCNFEGELLLAASGVGPKILLFRYQWNEWTEMEIPVAGPRNEAPSFVSWSPDSPDHSILLFGQGETVATFTYNKAGTPTWLTHTETLKVDRPKLPNHEDIRDVTWDATIGGEDNRPIILLGDSVLFFEHPRLAQPPPAVLNLQLGPSDFAMKLGWSDEGTRLNVYCYRSEEFVTLTLVCSTNGQWKLIN